MSRSRASVALARALRVTAAHAGEAPAESEPDGGPSAGEAPEPPRDPATLPDFMRHKARMSDEDLADKVEGGYVTGLPLLGSDPDTGFGFGARAIYFANGPRADRMFEHTPYRHRVFGQAFFTTNGYQFHTIDYDAPYLKDEPVRPRSQRFAFILAPFFDVGRVFDTLDDFELRRFRSG